MVEKKTVEPMNNQKAFIPSRRRLISLMINNLNDSSVLAPVSVLKILHFSGVVTDTSVDYALDEPSVVAQVTGAFRHYDPK